MKVLTIVVVAAVLGVVGARLWYVNRYAHRVATFQGRTVGQWLQILGTTKTGSENPLELKRVSTGAEHGDVAFEVPISYDKLYNGGPTNAQGSLALFVDGKLVSHPERASNGNCLLIWPEAHAQPGLHQLQAQVLLGLRDRVGVDGLLPLQSMGPTNAICTTNGFRFDPFYNAFSPSRGAMLHAELASFTATYEVTLYDLKGNHVRTFEGAVSNGLVHEHWDLVDARGGLFTNEAVNAVFRITLAGGASEVRTQTMYRALP